MATVNSADKILGLVLVRTGFVWTYMKGGLLFGLKFGAYSSKFHCKVVLISGGLFFVFGVGMVARWGLSVEFYGYVTKQL